VLRANNRRAKTVARRSLFLLSFICGDADAGYDSFEKCIIKEMPGVQNDLTARAIYSQCQSHERAVPGGGREDWFSFKSGAECAAKVAKETSSRDGAYIIRTSCNRLYDEPPPSILDGLQPQP
jgi:hypothetical protein